jgi:hypothetical protein
MLLVSFMEGGWAGHGEMNTQAPTVLFCKPEGKKELGVSMRIILNWILRE